MPVQVRVSYQLDESKVSGGLIPTDGILAQVTDVTFTCDNPTCAKNFGGKQRSFFWQAEKVSDDAAELPDDAYRIVNLELFNGKKYAFCGHECVVRALGYLEPLESPREKTSNVVAMPPKDAK